MSPVSQFLVRPAEPLDSLSVAGVVKSVFDEYGFTWDEQDYCADLYDLGSRYLQRGHKFWVAESNGLILGCAGLCFHPLIPGRVGDLWLDSETTRAAGSDCSLERLYVHPEARRMGIGRSLTQVVIDTAQAANRRAMEIWSDKRFGDAHRLYGRFGARVVGDRVCDDPDESPEWGLILEF